MGEKAGERESRFCECCGCLYAKLCIDAAVCCVVAVADERFASRLQRWRIQRLIAEVAAEEEKRAVHQLGLVFPRCMCVCVLCLPLYARPRMLTSHHHQCKEFLNPSFFFKF